MLSFVAKAFRGLVTVVLVLMIIGFAVIGAVVGGIAGDSGYAFLFFLLGGFIGFIIAILFGGFIANFLNMVDNIEKQTIYLQLFMKNQNIKIPKDMSEKFDEIEKIETKNIVFDDKWKCGKCGTINGIYLITCKKCGKDLDQE